MVINLSKYIYNIYMKQASTIYKNDSEKRIKSVCSINIPTIITALHNKALNVVNSKEYTPKLIFINSAITNDNKDKEYALNGAGDHIISIMPKDNNVSVPKDVAINALKTYVHWFAGPDLVYKVNKSNVKAIDDLTYNNKSDKHNKLNETFCLSFNQYLLNEKTSVPNINDETGEGVDGNDETGKGEDINDETGKGEDINDETGEGFDGDDQPIGYYIQYSLKIDGVKHTAMRTAVKKFLTNAFDDLTITSSGLFGSGSSFTIKDIKNYLKQQFGNIDPNTLISNIKNTCEKKYGHDVDVDILSKEKIFRQYKNILNATQKSIINIADYSVVVITSSDVKREINSRIIADIITSSIPGNIYKKYKHKVLKNDVIYIPNQHKQVQSSLRTNNIKTLFISPIELKIKLRAENTYKHAWNIIKSMFDRITKHNDYKSNEDIIKLNTEYLKLLAADNQANNDTKIDTITKKQISSNDIEKHFEQFLNIYTKFYNDHIDDQYTSLSETDSIINNIISESIRTHLHLNTDRIKQQNRIRSDIMDILFNQTHDLVENEFGDDIENDYHNNVSHTSDIYIIPMRGLEYNDQDQNDI